MKKVYSTKDAVSHLAEFGIKTTKSTLDTWRSSGTGPECIRIRGKVYYTPEALAAYFSSGREVA